MFRGFMASTQGRIAVVLDVHYDSAKSSTSLFIVNVTVITVIKVHKSTT